MPVHDWTKVLAGTFHSFHTAWIVELTKVLNQGLLPHDYYALAEQTAGQVGPDVLTLRRRDDVERNLDLHHEGLTAVADAPPRVEVVETASEIEFYTERRRTLTIRHATSDEVVAIIEVLSPGNKAKRKSFEKLVDKALMALESGCHLLLIDLFPPGSFDPMGIHAAVWDNFSEHPYAPPPSKRLTLASYSAGDFKRAYVQPISVGDSLPDMPLFLESEWYVNVPLESTYTEAYSGMPSRWRAVLEA